MLAALYGAVNCHGQIKIYVTENLMKAYNSYAGIALLFLSGGLVACSPAEDRTPIPVAPVSLAKVCGFSEGLAEYAAKPDDTRTLRLLNERWRSLVSDDLFLSEQTAQQSRQRLTVLNYQLAEESLQLLEQTTAIAAETYQKLEPLRQYSGGDMGSPRSVIRDLNNQLQACCMAKLDANATALVREDKQSVLYQVGEIAYYVQRDLGHLVQGELDFTEYRDQLAATQERFARTAQPEYPQQDWAHCQRRQ